MQLQTMLLHCMMAIEYMQPKLFLILASSLIPVPSCAQPLTTCNQI